MKRTHDRKSWLKGVRRVVVKIGSGILTSSDAGGLDQAHIQCLADNLSAVVREGYELIMVSSGAIAAGRKKLGFKNGLRSIPEKQAAAAVGQAGLMWVYEKSFGNNRLKVAQILLTRDDLSDRRRFLNARNTLFTLLKMGVIPIINENDTVITDEIKFGDNDNLSALVTNLVQADILINLSDIDGLFNADPKMDSRAELVDLVAKIDAEIEGFVSHHISDTGTGGMASKLQAAKMASAFGVPMVIANGTTATIVQEILEGRHRGTLFLPRKNKVNSWKHWIAYTLRPSGWIIVDTGARKVIIEGGKSLLPSGIIEVEGKFERGEAIRCSGTDRVEFARGLVNYSASEILKIKGLKTTQIESKLGYKYYDEIIHRDDLVLI
jgi:glutamate 5-kinase